MYSLYFLKHGDLFEDFQNLKVLEYKLVEEEDDFDEYCVFQTDEEYGVVAFHGNKKDLDLGKSFLEVFEDYEEAKQSFEEKINVELD